MTQVPSPSKCSAIPLQWEALAVISSIGPNHMTEILAQPSLKDLAPRRGSLLLLPELQASDYLELESFVSRLNSSKVYRKRFDFAADSPVAGTFRRVVGATTAVS